MTRTMVTLAASVAASAHRDQTDKAGAPYFLHVQRVAELVVAAGGSPEALQVAWLHDVVEDTDTTLQDLRDSGFSEPVVAAVDAITRRPRESPDAYYARVRADPLARFVKLHGDIPNNTDPARLGQLDEVTQLRLSRKYAHALEQLT
jgi:hypothetical protein